MWYTDSLRQIFSRVNPPPTDGGITRSDHFAKIITISLETLLLLTDLISGHWTGYTGDRRRQLYDAVAETVYADVSWMQSGHQFDIITML